ncbi:MAG: ABC transporter substrate-binding protein [Halobacteriales archaeon]
MPSRIRDQSRTDGATSRRTFLQAAGAAGVAGLAGCLGGGGGDGDGDGDGGTATGTPTPMGVSGPVKYGILNPVSGAYSGLGPEQKRGAELAINYVNNSDEFDFTIEATFEDTETDPATAQQVAQKAVNQDGAQYLMGAISSSVAIGLNSFAAEEGVIYNPGGAAIPITGSQCNEFVFRAETNTAQVAEASAVWTLENLSSDVWFHIADYAYGQSVLKEWRSRMQAADAEFNEMGVTRAELGAKNFDPFISEMANSDAGVVVVGSTGGDFIRFAKQAAQQGLQDDMDIMSTTATFRVIRQGLGPEGDGIFSGTRYAVQTETGDNQRFVSSFEDEYGEVPENFSRVAYDSIRMTAHGIQEAGTTDPTEVKDVLSGLEVPSLFGPNRFRSCDHQAVNPVWIGKNVLPEGGDITEVELIEKKSGEAAIPPCDETGCEL